MKKSINKTDTNLESLVQQFYEYFSDGYKFEEFLKVYLEKLGLDEVVVTKRSRDGGIDLLAVRKGIGALGAAGSDNYYIQAKRYQPSKTISPEKIRALRGSINQQGKYLLITTAKISEEAKDDACNFDPQRPVIVIDGKDLVLSCIEHEIGFTYIPVFSASALDRLMNTQIETSREQNATMAFLVEKDITENDIRARIISIPRIIIEKIKPEKANVTVIFNNEYTTELTVVRGRNYFGGVTSVLRKLGMLCEDGTIYAKHAKWNIDEINQVITIVLI